MHAEGWNGKDTQTGSAFLTGAPLYHDTGARPAPEAGRGFTFFSGLPFQGAHRINRIGYRLFFLSIVEGDVNGVIDGLDRPFVLQLMVGHERALHLLLRAVQERQRVFGTLRFQQEAHRLLEPVMARPLFRQRLVPGQNEPGGCHQGCCGENPAGCVFHARKGG